MRNILGALLLALSFSALVPAAAHADAHADGGACPRFAPGSDVQQPPDLFSQNGRLDVAMNYLTSVDAQGRTLFCFVTSDGKESPTLHVNPGDAIHITLTNMVPAAPGAATMRMSRDGDVCGDATQTATSVNMHFHGTNTSPKCHSDEVIHTLINSGSTFEYTLHIPADEPPGLYWYHPHVHGISSPTVQGGATGAIEVEGIANVQPAVSGLAERFLVLRDERFILPTNPPPPGSKSFSPLPFWDVTVNYTPVPWPHYPPSIVRMQTGSKEFWRVVNAGANTIMDLKLMYDGTAQPLQVVALDGVPTGSKDGRRQGTIVTKTDLVLPPSSRVEFIVTAPTSSSTNAILETEAIDGGPVSDSNPQRPLIQIVASDAPVHLARLAQPKAQQARLRFDDLANAKVTATRSLYFDEHSPPGALEHEGTTFFITVDGQQEELFDPNNPPAIVTNQGAVEEWTIRNQTGELHEFHMHQIHFLVEAVDGVEIPRKKQQLYDVYQVGYWTGQGDPPSIKIKLDFRGPDTGDFVYHCHILDHEDGGMMAIIRVLPKT
jgi:FtsP/CotA-like multicopper oxidase with cupredoxin domain